MAGGQYCRDIPVAGMTYTFASFNFRFDDLRNVGWRQVSQHTQSFISAAWFCWPVTFLIFQIVKLG